MRTALDTSVILDVLVQDSEHAPKSEAAIRKASQNGKLVICECVLAELTPALAESEIPDFLDDWGIAFVPSTESSSILAGKMFAKYLGRRNAEARVLPDFLIGAHAIHHADALLARDRGYYRDYFAKLKLIRP